MKAWITLTLCARLVSLVQGQDQKGATTLITTLSNGEELPLVGMGVGNLAHEHIVSVVSRGTEMGYRLVDTAHASQNEGIVREAVDRAVEGTVHVITKVWYTYLGYERTKMSVQNSLLELHSTNENMSIRVHVLLHWPRCRSDIEWMDCEKEEEDLPDNVKKAGPPPHLEKDAWKSSWRALEDMYLSKEYPAIASIGVSNFDLHELKELVEISRVQPHLIQDNIWKYVLDPFFVDFCRDNQIHFQAYNVINGILSGISRAPNAFETLWVVANGLEGEGYYPIQVVLAWLVQNGVSVIPRTADDEHLLENSPASLAKVPHLDESQHEIISKAISALLVGQDLDPPTATFLNTLSSMIHLFWVDGSGDEVPVKMDLRPGEVFHASTFPGHTFVAYDEAKTIRKEYLIQANFGFQEDHRIEL